MGRKRFCSLLLASILLGLAFAAIYVRWFRHGLPRDVREALHGSSSLTLASIDPDTMRSPPEDLDGKELLHGCRVLGRLPLMTPNPVIEALEKMDRSYHANSISVCFKPRHALEARMASGSRRELLVCFECSNLKWYIDGRQEGWLSFPRMDAAPLNSLLTAEGIQLPKQPD